ncbi:MAG: hypothetical protein BWY70_00785 [Bacteroidetes bacterium ADurb.Bin408]|nr:MAG: hypothetical protein BWY70_00785 [Bacteroidetes bacterium ADurb.Bin408]
MNCIKHIFLVILIFIELQYVSAQYPSIGGAVSNNVTSFPVTGFPQLFYSQFHPGLNAFMEWKINKSEKHQLCTAANLGFFYHRFIQSGVRIYPELDYKFFVNKQFNLNFGLGLGYLHSFEGYDVVIPLDNGGYKTRSAYTGRPQLLAVLNMGCAYKLSSTNEKSPSLLLQLHTNMQGPFVNSYVPVLPVNSLHIGISFPVIKNK